MSFIFLSSDFLISLHCLILLITTYKISNGLCPENLKNKFTPRSNISRYNTRKIDDFEIPRLRLEYCKKSFGYQGASAWNEIPKQIRDSASLSSFKVRLREFFFCIQI